jgi:glycosyltransferase involved in cell wall biosynthesis
MSSIEEQMARQDNDYSHVEIDYYHETGVNLVDNINGKVSQPDATHGSETVSIVVPSYEGHVEVLDLLNRLAYQSFKNFEIVIVDDGSPNPLFDRIEQQEVPLPIKIIRQNKNKGRSYTRNTGLIISESPNVVFVDHDTLFDNNFVANFATRLTNTDNCVFLGFREEVKSETIDPGRRADYKKDWRNSITIDKNFQPYTVVNQKVLQEMREYKLLEETDFLKALGCGAVLGYWNLASAVVSHGMGVKRKDVLMAQGFPEQGFNGWGFEDSALGAKLISQSSLIIPCVDIASFHLKKPTNSIRRRNKDHEINNNTAAYNALLRSPLEDVGRLEQRRISKIGVYPNIELYEVD